MRILHCVVLIETYPALCLHDRILTVNMNPGAHVDDVFSLRCSSADPPGWSTWGTPALWGTSGPARNYGGAASIGPLYSTVQQCNRTQSIVNL